MKRIALYIGMAVLLIRAAHGVDLIIKYEGDKVRVETTNNTSMWCAFETSSNLVDWEEYASLKTRTLHPIIGFSTTNLQQRAFWRWRDCAAP